ncbi:MAG: hypothetical protein R2779_11445 [Crocinitomicaceae bacterium]
MKKGEFVVKPSFLEQADNSANHALLKQLAVTTGGAFMPAKKYKTIIEQINQRKILQLSTTKKQHLMI